MLLHAFMTWRVLERHAPAPDPSTSVDVFIPTYNEPVEMLRRTVLAARDMKHPHQTWLLDDGRRPEMAALAAELGVHYLARPDNAHAKAGNLNYALVRSQGDVIAIFDADHVPHEDYLVSTLGYFRDPDIAFVQTPQDFYNLDSFQHRRSAGQGVIWTEQSLFFRVIMPGKDFWNAAFFCGSCATIRRAAVLDIGGFATETVTEDLHTSIRLHKKGYGSVYHSESLAFGIAPDTFEPYESQRVRWGQGAMQVWRKEGMLTARGLTIPQRLCYFASVVTYFDGWQKAFMYFLPSFVLATGILPVAFLDWHFVAFFGPWWFLSLWTCEELGQGYARTWLIEQYNFLRYPGFLFATLTLFLNRRLRFTVTKKGADQGDGTVRRLLPHIAVVAIAALACGLGVPRYLVHPYMPLGAFLLNLVWVAVVSTVAGHAIRFACGRAKQERETYRFHLPLPMLLRWPDQRPRLVAAEDVSSSGVQIRQQTGMRKGAWATSDLILPAGRLSVPLTVRRAWANEDAVHIALQFEWPDKEGADALDRYLYGSNAEWLFNGMRERKPTPLERIALLFGRQTREPVLAEKGWRTAVVLPADFHRSVVGLVKASDMAASAPTLLCARPLPWDKITIINADSSAQIYPCRIIGIAAQKIGGTTYYRHQLLPRADADETSIPPMPVKANKGAFA